MVKMYLSENLKFGNKNFLLPSKPKKKYINFCKRFGRVWLKRKRKEKKRKEKNGVI